MTPVLTQLISFVLLYKYLAIFLITYIASSSIPLPSNVLLLPVGAFASQGYINFWIVLVIAVVSNVLGDSTDYFLARRFGETIIKKLRLNKLIFWDYLTEEIKKDSKITIFITRFAGSLCQITSVLAGFIKVPFKRFLILDFLGNLIQQSTVLTVGFFVGESWGLFSNIFNISVGIIAAGITIFILRRIQKKLFKNFSSKKDD